MSEATLNPPFTADSGKLDSIISSTVKLASESVFLVITLFPPLKLLGLKSLPICHINSSCWTTVRPKEIMRNIIVRGG